MAKKVAGTMKLQVPAGQANPSPGNGGRCTVPDRDHLLSGQILFHGYQDAACVLLPEKSGQREIRRQHSVAPDSWHRVHKAGARNC